MSAPASAPWVEGGVGVQKSSQISTWNEKPGNACASNTRSVPKGATAGPIRTSRPRRPAPGENQRFS